MAEPEESWNGRAEAKASGEEASPRGPTKLRSASVSVLEPSASKVKDGKILPFSVGRTRTSSTRSSTSSTNRGWGKDVWVKAKLFLTPLTLCYSIEGKGVCEFLLEDVLGVQVIKTAPKANPKACEFNLHLFLVTSAPRAKRKVRTRCTATILFDSSQSFAENLQLASQWKTAVLLQVQSAVESTFGEPGMQREGHNGSLAGESESILLPRSFLVFINPKAGQQKGVSLFRSEVKPMLDLAEIICDEVVTERANHAREVIKTYNLKKIHAIVIASGDGLLHEVINGIMERKDWQEAIKTPIGMLPTGSGNGLCASALLESDEEYGLDRATFQIIRGGVVPLDIATVQFNNGTSIYMSLLAAWGIIADVDIESEKFRKMGKTRFLLGALSSMLKKKIYKGRLSYLPTEGEGAEPSEIVAMERASRSSSEASSSGGCPEEDSLPLRTPILQEEDRREEEEEEGEEGEKEGPPLNLPPTDLLAPLTQPVPETWTTKEGDFLTVTPTMVPLISSNFYGDPEVRTGAGSIRLVWVDGDVTRKDVFEVMSSAGAGKHMDLEKVYGIDVRAFRLEPLVTPGGPGVMTVDGEVVPYGPLQVQVHPHLARVISRRRKKS